MNFALFASLGLVAISAAAHAAPPAIPTAPEAHAAVLKLLGEDMPGIKNSQLAIGTCLPAPGAPHWGQVSCTTVLLMPAGRSEAPMDFYRQGETWTATPPTNLQLPFPDPKLADQRWQEGKAGQ